MIRRSERDAETTHGGITTLWRVTRIHVLGFCVWNNQVEKGQVTRPPETRREPPVLRVVPPASEGRAA